MAMAPVWRLFPVMWCGAWRSTAESSYLIGTARSYARSRRVAHTQACPTLPCSLAWVLPSPRACAALSMFARRTPAGASCKMAQVQRLNEGRSAFRQSPDGVSLTHKSCWDLTGVASARRSVVVGHAVHPVSGAAALGQCDSLAGAPKKVQKHRRQAHPSSWHYAPLCIACCCMAVSTDGDGYWSRGK
jgi:hypothetical protein